jgi:hypothetical protein
MKSNQYAVLAVCTAAAALTVLAGPEKTYFTVVDNPVSSSMGQMFTDGSQMFILGAESTYNEVATDPRLTGPKVIHCDAMFDLPSMTGRMWGRSHKEHPDGAWDGYWTGTRTAFTDPDGTPHVRSTIVSVAVGSGAFEGLIARWDLSAVDAGPGTAMTGTGYIVEAEGGPGQRPMKWKATRTEQLTIHLGKFLPSETFGAMATFDFLSDSGVGTHLGQLVNHGSGLIDLNTGLITGAGYLSGANSDEILWVATGDAATGNVEINVHFAGGTGRFESAIGGVDYSVQVALEGPGPVYVIDYGYSTAGSIQY